MSHINCMCIAMMELYVGDYFTAIKDGVKDLLVSYLVYSLL